MPRMRSCGGIIALLFVLALVEVSGLRAQGTELEAAWRQMFKRPSGPPPSPPDNPFTPDKAALGERLFSDARLSGKGDRSCASCHKPERTFTDGRRRALSLSGAPLRRNTPSLWNLAWGKLFFWDGRASSLETQVGMPIEESQEMGGDWPTILRRLEADDVLTRQFRAAFPEEPAVSRDTISKALASYVRSLVSPPTRFDAWIGGDAQALSSVEARGFGIFVGKAGCVLCHVGWRFTDDRFHDIGLRSVDGGRGAVPGGTPGLSAFKTPGLREIVHTAPYMHDGSLATLDAVLKHYTGGFVARPSLATHINRRLRLTVQEKADLIAFLGTLSNEPGPARERRTGPD
jgi:cytochrome c peroxidase